MEFGVFLNGYIPGPGGPQHRARAHELMREAEYVIFADKHNWKYAWFGEHHAPHRVQPHVGARGRHGLHRRPDRLHPPLAPASTASRRARSTRSATPSAPRCSTTSPTTASSGAPAAAPAATRSRPSTSSTRTPPRPSGKRSSRRSRACGSRSTTRSTASTSPCRRRTTSCPKPYGKGHPPIWVACGNPPTFNRAGELGIGAIAFNFEPIFNLRGRIEAYKEGIANCTEPIGQFKNDNVMITNSVICCETREEARKIALRKGRGYLVSMVNLYHDTMPKSQDAITWPSAPLSLRDLAGGRRGRAARRPHRGRLHAAAARPTRCREQIAKLGRRRHGPARVRPARSRACTTRRSSPASSSSATRSSPSSTRTARTPPTTTAARRKPKFGTFSKPAARGRRVADGHPGERARAARLSRRRRPATPVPRDATATKERAAPRGGAAVREARALPGHGARDHRGGRAAQRLGAQLPLRVARGRARRDPRPPRRARPTSRGASCSTRSGRDAPTRDLVAALVVPYAAHLAAARRARLPAHRGAAVGRVQHVARRRRRAPGPCLRRDPRHPRGAPGATLAARRCGGSGSSR